MLKLIRNEIPTWTIDWTNKAFTVSGIISHIDIITVDWIELESGYKFSADEITLDVAPTSTIVVSFFKREELDVLWDGTVTIWDLVNDIYDEIGRKQYSRIYPKERIIREINKTIGVLFDITNSRERIQHYSLRWINGLTVTTEWNTVDLTTPETYNLDITWTFLVDTWVYYDYYNYDGTKFTVAWADMIDDYDKINIGHRIPYGVDRIAELWLNGVKLEPIDPREFNFSHYDKYTTMRDSQGNRYIFLPWSDKEYDCVVKFVPDHRIMLFDDDIVNLEYKYTRVVVYDICYRLLSSRDDDRWERYKRFLEEEKIIYKAYKAKQVDRQRSKIWIAPVYENTKKFVNIMPEGIYDQYK